MLHFALMLLMFAQAASGKIDFQAAHLEKKLKAVRTSDRIAIDGRLDEKVWESAPLAGNFTQSEPSEGAPASEKTEVRVLYDNENLYLGVQARDSEAKHVVISDLKKDFNAGDSDSFEVILDTFHDLRNGYQFAVNPAGAKWDSQMINEGRESNASWDGVWSVKTRIVDEGWTAEIAIPFRTLKFRESDVQSWGINFHRNLRSNVRNEDSFWSPIPRIFNIQRVSIAGTLEDLEGIRPGSNLRFKPYIIGSYAENAAHVGDRKADAGFDAKYGVTSGLTWDFTYRTDFSQVEADEQQVNLTRFSLFFPEKRDFFLENSGIFQFGVANDRGGGAGGGGGGGGGGRQNAIGNDMIFFFSRNIGLSSTGDAIPILGGTRLTGRTGRFEIGLLNMQQRRSGTNNAVNFSVLRLRRNVLQNSDIGFMMTNKEVSKSANFNRVVGGDANFRFGRYTAVNTYLAKAITPVKKDHQAAGRASVSYIDPRWNFRTSYTNVEQNFTNEMGFVPRLGVRKVASYLGVTFRPKRFSKTIRQIFPHSQIDYVLNKDGKLDTRYIDYHLPINFQNGAFIEVGSNPSLELLTSTFTINRTRNITIPSGRYSYNEWFVTGNTDRSRRVFANGRVGVGTFYTGNKNSYTMGATWRAHYRLNTSFNYTQNSIDLPQGKYRTNLLSTRVNVSFTTAMFVNALIQYNDDVRQWTSNVRFNIIHRPLSDLFVVYNERRGSVSHNLIDRALIAKVTYMMSR